MRGTQVTSDGVKKLRRALPECKIRDAAGRAYSADDEEETADRSPRPAPSTESMAQEVEWNLKQLRPHFAGKTDEQIIQALRSYIASDDSTEKDSKRWFAERLQRATQQRKAMIWFASWAFFYDYQLDEKGEYKTGAVPAEPDWLRKLLGDDFLHDVVEAHLGGLTFDPPVYDRALVHLKPLTTLRRLNLCCTHVTDEGLKHIRGLARLEELNLSGTEISGEGLMHLKDLTRLEELDLSSSKVSDEGLSHVKGLPRLKVLTLRSTAITDDALEHLKDLPQIQTLDLSQTKITDAGLKHLEGLTQLQRLKLGWNGISDAGVEHLQKLLALQELNLKRTAVTGATFDRLRDLTQLHEPLTPRHQSDGRRAGQSQAVHGLANARPMRNNYLWHRTESTRRTCPAQRPEPSLHEDHRRRARTCRAAQDVVGLESLLYRNHGCRARTPQAHERTP